MFRRIYLKESKNIQHFAALYITTNLSELLPYAQENILNTVVIFLTTLKVSKLFWKSKEL